ncbi:tRNA nuclease WapA precursor [compost metagenome]
MKRAILAMALLFSAQAFALVDMKNANYSNTWIDMDVPGSGYDLKIVRTYNSRSLFNGMFGFGWCSDFETSMEVTAEGNVKVKECGGGLEVVFAPREISRKDVDSTINRVISKMKAEKKVGLTEASISKLKTQLLEDDSLRSEYARQYGVAVSIKEGTKFFANGREVEHFVFNKTYYTRNLPDGTSQRYNTDGKLTHIYDKNRNFLKFDYDKTNTIAKIEDNNNRRLVFKYFSNKKVKSITGPNGLLSEYKFANLDDLSTVKNAWNKTYTYQYDEFHNLTKATWPDKTFIAIKYDVQKDWVTGFTDRDKCNESYKYEFSAQDPRNHYWSTVKKVCGKEVMADNKYEFWHKQRADGQYYLQRVLTTVSGSTTDITYHEVFGKPLSIRRNADRVSYEYYQDGLVKAKATPAMKMSFNYDAQIKKVSQVSTVFFNEKGAKVSTKATQFKYDNRGNLSFAQNSDGQKITMTYDNRGRISSITDQAKKVVKIEYEERYGKPSIVTRPGLGTIVVSYKANGEINKVDSKEGPSVAMQVASTFNNLLDIIAPATAELYL